MNPSRDTDMDKTIFLIAVLAEVLGAGCHRPDGTSVPGAGSGGGPGRCAPGTAIRERAPVTPGR